MLPWFVAISVDIQVCNAVAKYLDLQACGNGILKHPLRHPTVILEAINISEHSLVLAWAMIFIKENVYLTVSQCFDWFIYKRFLSLSQEICWKSAMTWSSLKSFKLLRCAHDAPNGPAVKSSALARWIRPWFQLPASDKQRRVSSTSGDHRNCLSVFTPDLYVVAVTASTPSVPFVSHDVSKDSW